MSRDSEDESGEITRLISEFVAGVPGAQDRLFPLIYDELHGRAARIQRERPGETLCPTELVNEAYLRLVQQRFQGWQDRRHFLVFAAQVIRRVLVDRARARNAQKRGGGARQRSLATIVDARPLHDDMHQLDVLALEEALDELAENSPSAAQVVELKFFAGLSSREAAEVAGVHEITVKRHWKFARAWLLARMQEQGGSG